MTWHQGRMCLFDLETTGVDPHRDRIVTAAAILAGGGQNTEQRDWLVQPTIPIPQGATDIHGISDAHARKHGEPAASAVRDIADTVLWAASRGVPIVGHNVTYDLTMLLAECLRHNVTPQADELSRIRPVVDTLVLDKWADKWRKGSRKLVDVARHYGVELSDIDAHGAAADALAAGRVAWKIAQRWPGAQGTALEVHELCRVEKREQAESFGAYLVRQGKPDDVSREWPIQTFPEGWLPSQEPAERAVA